MAKSAQPGHHFTSWSETKSFLVSFTRGAVI
jgi:hypothetical protein